MSDCNRIKKLYEKSLFYSDTDPEVALAQSRKSAEAILKSIYVLENLVQNSKPVEKMMLNELITVLSQKNILPNSITINLHTIQHFGNFGVHDQGLESECIDINYVKPCLLALGTVFNWYMQKYSDSFNHDSMQLFKRETPEEAPSNPLNKLIVIGNHAPPARIFEEDMATGFYFDLLREIGRRKQIKFVFEQSSNNMAFKKLRQGKADVMSGPNKTPERLEEFIYSNLSLPQAKKSFFVSIDAMPILKYEDLYDRILIMMSDANYSDTLKHDDQIHKVYVPNYEISLKRTSQDTSFVSIMPTLQGEYLIDQLGLELMRSPYTIDGNPSFIIFGQHVKQEIIDQVNQGLEEVIQSDYYKKILRMYEK